MKERTALTLAGLAFGAFVSGDSDVGLDMDFRILRSDITAVARAVTSTEGNGLILYMHEGDLSAAEAEENIELDGPVRLGQQIEEETATRWVRRVGILQGSDIATERVFTNEHGGGLLTINPRWTFRRARTVGQGGWNWGVFNSGATVTTGIVLDILATHYGVWVT